MNASKIKFIGGILLAFILGWVASQFYNTQSVSSEDTSYVVQEDKSESRALHKNSISSSTQKAPSYVLETLEYILEHNEAPAGYVGGRTFQNREGLLPKKSKTGNMIHYREWDVHPKVKNQNRGTERLITSNQGDAYFTSNHYQSFQKIQ